MPDMIIADIQLHGHHVYLIRNHEATTDTYTGTDNNTLCEFLNALGREENIDRITIYGPRDYTEHFIDELGYSGVFNYIEIGEF